MHLRGYDQTVKGRFSIMNWRIQLRGVACTAEGARLREEIVVVEVTKSSCKAWSVLLEENGFCLKRHQKREEYNRRMKQMWWQMTPCPGYHNPGRRRRQGWNNSNPRQDDGNLLASASALYLCTL